MILLFVVLLSVVHILGRYLIDANNHTDDANQHAKQADQNPHARDRPEREPIARRITIALGNIVFVVDNIFVSAIHPDVTFK